MYSLRDRRRDAAYKRMVKHSKACTWCRYPPSASGEVWPDLSSQCDVGQEALAAYIKAEAGD